MPTDRVTWHNNSWPSVTIEIRRGNDAVPSNNPVVRTPTIAQGAYHEEFSDGEDFFWFRATPRGDGVYIHRPCYGNGETYDENIT